MTIPRRTPQQSRLRPRRKVRPKAAPNGGRLLGLLVLALALVMGCQTEPPNTPDPAPDGGTVSANGIAGRVQAPPAMQKDNGGAWDNVRGPLNEAPLAGVQVYLLGARGETIEGFTPVQTDAKGIFRFDATPAEAGLIAVMPKAVEASKPLLAYYRRGHASYVGVSSTLVAGALREAVLAKPSLTYAAFDPDKVSQLQEKVEIKVAKGTTVLGLYYLDQVLIDWARADAELKAPLEALAPGITAPRVQPTPPGLKR